MITSKIKFLFKPASENGNTFVKALFISILCVFFTYQCFTPSYLTNDDPGYSMILSGKMVFNTSTPYILFQNICYTSSIQYLYSKMPNITWYSMVQVSLLFVCLLINNCIILKKYPTSFGLFMSILLYVSFFSFFFLRLHFTITSFVLGITAFIVLLHSKRSSKKLFSSILILVLLLFSSMIRWEAWQLTILWITLFLVINYGMDLLKGKNTQYYKYGFFILLSSLILCVGFMKIDDHYYKKTANQDYRTFNFYRAHINDYHDLMYLKRDERMNLLQKNGWSNNDYEMTMYWMFMDRDVYATAKLKSIVDGVNQRELQQQRISYNIKNLIAYIHKNTLLQFLFVTSIFVLLFLARGNKNAYLIFLISLLLLIATSMMKKFPPESFYSAIFLMLPFYLIEVGFIEKRKFFIVIIFSLFAFFQVQKIKEQSDINRKEQFLFSQQLLQITKDTSHIYLNWAGINTGFIKPFDHSNLMAKNIIFPGTFAAHPLNLAKIKSVGIQDLMLEMTTNPRILVIHKAQNEKQKKEIEIAQRVYITYVKEHYHIDVKATKIDSSLNMTVWDYSPQESF